MPFSIGELMMQHAIPAPTNYYTRRTDKVEILAEYQYEDSSDVFQREPFSLLLASSGNGI